MHDFERFLEGRTLILLSNREPYEHAWSERPPGSAEDGGTRPDVEVRRPAGGLVSALDPTMRRTRGVWVAWGSGSADREAADADGRVAVPPEDPRYTVRRVWLDEAEVEGYYHGFANSSLWPLCHLLVQHFHYADEEWARYRAVNGRFADAAADEVARAPLDPVVWVQDFHLALAPQLLRERVGERDPGLAARLSVHQFWHIPFPPPDLFNLLPTEIHAELLLGMLGNDLIEFHTARHAMNFMDCVAAFVPGAEVRREHQRVRVAGRTTHTGAFPISIDVDHYESLAGGARDAARALRARLAPGDRTLAVSVDRVDYTKGIPERLRALDQLFDEAPEVRGRLTVVVVATPSRTELPAYQALDAEVRDLVSGINDRWGADGWSPIVLEHRSVPADELAALYRAADVCLVSSLQDGMNLVAKEFIACNLDERGVLVLSRMAGAAEELDGAVLINPFNQGGFVAGIREALAMPREERRARMRRMRADLHRATIFDWLEAILARVDELMTGTAVTGTAGAGGADALGAGVRGEASA